MKVATFRSGGQERLGFVVEDFIVDPLSMLSDSDAQRAYFLDTIAFMNSGDDGTLAARRLIESMPESRRIALSSVELAPPIKASTILCSGSNYHDHNKEKAASPVSGKEPEFFVKTSDCVIGPDEHIVYDDGLSTKLDAETELALVIGKLGRHIAVEDALDHVFGYTIVDDVTARDRQVRQKPDGSHWYELGRGKVFDTSAPMGPWIVTADEIEDPQALRLRTRINGELRQSASTANMIWSCAELIHFFSANLTLRPGIVIITGTPGGTAWSVDPELGGKWVGGDGSEKLTPATRYLLPGDRIECELEGIGVLRNEVV